MAARDLTVDIDAFDAGIEALIGDVPVECSDACEKAVRQSIRKTAKELRSGEHGSSGKHEWSDEYMSGFSSAMTKGGATPAGEVGNNAKPGLVHLVEKGHTTLTGRRTTAYPHMEPAFVSMTEDFVDRTGKYIMEALR